MDNFVKWIQEQLIANGFNPGKADGYDGPKTRAAVEAFQKSKGLNVTGTATSATVDALRGSQRAPESVSASKSVWPTQANVPSFYGARGANLTTIQLPYAMTYDGKTVTKMTLHKKCAESAHRALSKIGTIYNAKERSDLGLDIFGGSFNIRKMRGGNSWSMHSWAIAIDFDPNRNQLRWGKPKARLSHDDAVPFWEAWEAEGWVSLGRERNYDFMHVQAARL